MLYKFIVKIIVRRLMQYVKFFGRGRNVILLLPLLLLVLILWVSCWRLVVVSSRALLPPLPPDQPMHHLRGNRKLRHYMNNVQLLVGPTSVPCSGHEVIPVIILVASAPSRFHNRHAARQTWARFQPTYFVLGLHGDKDDERMGDNYVEAKDYGDIIIYEFHDHYQNLTLKTALMMKWTLENCPRAEFVFKTDDDVMVNPWTMDKVLKDHGGAHLVGYKHINVPLHMEEYNKWYIPRWPLNEEKINKYLGGAGYLINGGYLRLILEKAYQVPMVNLEDVYFTYLVAQKELGLTITHDRRLSAKKAMLKFPCVYWGLASTHDLSPNEMLWAWAKIEDLVFSHNNTKSICMYYSLFFYLISDFLSS